MKELKFTAKEQILSLDSSCSASRIVPGSKGYLRAVFKMDKTWNGCAIIASFANRMTSNAVMLDENNACMIPDGIPDTTLFSVQLIGVRPGFRLQTQQLRIRQGG